MSGFFQVGETKDRPGVYHRIENAGGVEIAGARTGIGCAVVSGNWGPLNTPVSIDPSVDITTVIGAGTGAVVIQEMFTGGVQELVVVRVGSGGSEGCTTLKGTNLSDTKDAIKLTAKYPGSRKFSVSVRKSLDNAILKELTIYEGTKALETVSWVESSNDVVGLEYALKDSKYVKTEVINKMCSISEVQQQAFDVGTDPTVDTEAYSTGFSAAEPEKKDMIVVDTDDPAVHNLLAAFIERIYQDGEYPMACVAEKSETSLDDRMLHAGAFNDEKVMYVLNSWVDSAGIVYEGYRAAARIAGMICSGSAAESLTHTVIKGAVGLREGLTNAQIKAALRSGCLVLTVSKSRQIQIEKAINTLVTPDADQDAGWKKIRRVKERFELMDRIDTTLDPMVGKVDNDTDGRAAIVAAAQRVIDAMIGEKKLLAGTVVEDEGNPPRGDMAWFILAIDDLDSIETIYLTYRFRFAAEDAE